jgi:hypothetical protein
MHLVIIMDNGWIASVFSCKTESDAIDLARSLMEDMSFNPAADDVAIFRPIPRQQTYDLVLRWQDIYPDWEKE